MQLQNEPQPIGIFTISYSSSWQASEPLWRDEEVVAYFGWANAALACIQLIMNQFLVYDPTKMGSDIYLVGEIYSEITFSAEI